MCRRSRASMPSTAARCSGCCAAGSAPRPPRTHFRWPAGGEVPEIAVEDGRPDWAGLGELTEGLPPTERAAVVLRYGFDLPYDRIAAALGSGPAAARPAGSPGVRRLRGRSAP